MPELTWIGKDAVRRHHLDVPFRPLAHQYDFAAPAGPDALAGPAHRIIHGDNLEALKSLLPEYEGRVRCIYIDPPYNTGNEGWVYNDNVSDPRLLKWLRQVVGKEGDDLSRHDKWLCMMYPRLKLLHKLLSEDGAIFISIDDSEQANLKLVMDEIFGANNFVTTVIWRKNYAPKSSAMHFSEDHEYILIYAKNAANWRVKLMPRTEKQDKAYKNPDKDPRGPWRPNNLAARNFYSKGTYAITTPSGRVVEGPPPGSYWRVSEDKFNEMDKDGRIWWGKDGNNVPAPKIFLSEVKQGVVPQTFWSYEEVGHTQEAKREVLSILDKDNVFATPKPTKLIERILELATATDSIILDSFAGSGTTLHAVLNLNARDKEKGHRQCLLIEMEDYAETLTAERARRVATGYGSTAGTGGAFGFYTLGPALFGGPAPEGETDEADATALAPDAPVEALRQYVWYSETAQPLPAPTDTPDHPAYLGTAPDGTRVYLHYHPDHDTVLDRKLALALAPGAPRYVVYADACLLSEAQRTAQQLVFKKIPRDIVRF